MGDKKMSLEVFLDKFFFKLLKSDVTNYILTHWLGKVLYNSSRLRPNSTQCHEKFYDTFDKMNFKTFTTFNCSQRKTFDI